MAPRKVDAGDAAVVDLLEKLTQVGAPLVVYPGVGKEATAIAAFENAGGEIDVLEQTVTKKVSCDFEEGDFDEDSILNKLQKIISFY